MDLYSCRVRLKGGLLNTVNVENVTAAEIRVLDHIHTGDNPAVYDVAREGSVARKDAEERKRLADKYGEFMGQTGPSLIAQILGVPGVPLPQKLEDDDPRLVADNGIKKARQEQYASVQAKRKPDPLFDDGLEDEPVVVEAAKPADTPEPAPNTVRRHRVAQPASA